MSTSSDGKNGGTARHPAALGARVRAFDAKLGRQTGSGNARSGNALALVPLVIALLCAAVMLPRPAIPRDIPLPEPDHRALDALSRTEEARVHAARAKELPSAVRAVGSALRTFFTAQANDADADTLFGAKTAISAALDTERAIAGAEPLLQLRALDTDEFVAEVHKAERNDGAPPHRARFVSSTELEALAGPFSLRMKEAGFLADGVVQLSDLELRVLYRALWASATGLVDEPGFAATLDENRLRYALLLRQGHPAEHEAEKLASLPHLIALAGGGTKMETDAQRCEREDRDTRTVLASWRAQKVVELSQIDKAYPLAYALGILAFERGDYETSVKFFRSYGDEHPDGPYALRTANFLREAMKEAEATQ